MRYYIRLKAIFCETASIFHRCGCRFIHLLNIGVLHISIRISEWNIFVLLPWLQVFSLHWFWLCSPTATWSALKPYCFHWVRIHFKNHKSTNIFGTVIKLEASLHSMHGSCTEIIMWSILFNLRYRREWVSLVTNRVNQQPRVSDVANESI